MRSSFMGLVVLSPDSAIVQDFDDDGDGVECRLRSLSLGREVGREGGRGRNELFFGGPRVVKIAKWSFAKRAPWCEAALRLGNSNSLAWRGASRKEITGSFGREKHLGTQSKASDLPGSLSLSQRIGTSGTRRIPLPPPDPPFNLHTIPYHTIRYPTPKKHRHRTVRNPNFPSPVLS